MKLKTTAEKIYENDGNDPVLENITAAHKVVLDIGFGNGANARKLLNSGHVVDGVTLSPIEAEASKEIIRNIFIHNLETGLPAAITEKYDAVICSHVLEHISYPEKLLKGIHDCLKPDGILVVALPNLMYYRSRWELIKGNFPSDESGIWDNTHVRWYTFTSAQKLFTDHSFRVVKAMVTGDLPWLTVLRPLIKFPTRQKLYKILTRISKGFFGSQLLYVLQKAPVEISSVPNKTRAIAVESQTER